MKPQTRVSGPRQGLVAGLAACIALALLPVAPALAAPVAHGTLVSDDPADWTPDVEDGRVRRIVKVGDTYVAVGNFSQVTERSTGETFDRHAIFAFDSNGDVSETFSPEIDGSEVFDIVPAGDGETAYIGGLFMHVNDDRRPRVARINVTTGEVVQEFRGPSMNRKITALHLANGKLYAAGWFERVGGQDRTALVALDPETGNDTGTVNLRFRDTWNGGTVHVVEFTMTPDGSKLVAIGNFRRVEGQRRPQIAMIDTSGPQATLDSWATNRYSTTCSNTFDTYMWDIDSSPDGSYFAVVTAGAYSGGPNSGTLCDTTARWEFDTSGSGQQPTWIDYTGGDTVTAVAVTDTAVYVGGHFRWMNNPFAADRVGPGAVRRMGIAALDPKNGLPFRWNPGRARGWGIWGFTALDEGLWFGHDTDTVAGEQRKRVAFMPLEGGVTPPPNELGTLPGDTYLLGRTGNGVQRNAFDGSDVTETEDVDASGVDWSSSRGAFMVDDRLYNGWSDGTMTWRPYNKRKFLTPRNINLHGLDAFAEDLQQTRAMFFDGEQGRLYFTRQGSPTLYYRYFTPESNTVGAIRHESAGAGVNWWNVDGGFIAENTLYYRTTEGSLWSMEWEDGPVAGTQNRVSGPDIDGESWSSRSIFLYVD